MMIAPFVRSPYNYDADKVSEETGLACLDPSLADDSQREESDINTIVHRFGLTRELPEVRAPRFGDFTQVKDFKSAMDAVARARESFDGLPAEVRSRFRNDPQELVEFCSDDRNRSEAERLGLVFPKDPVVASAPDPVPDKA